MSKRAFALLLLAATGAEAAAPRLLAVSAGDCDHPELRSAARAVAQELNTRLPERTLEAGGAAQQLRPLASKSHEDIQRQIAAAQTQFYNLQYLKADQQLEETLQEIDRLPPGKERWNLSVAARLLRGVIQLGARQPARADESFRRVLALDPKYQMDTDYYSPSTRAAFERVRKGVLADKGAVLQVRANLPGADVFVDGLQLGKAPFSQKLPAGTYQVLVMRDGVSSFSRAVKLTDLATVHVDLGFEGSVKAGQPLCLQDAAGRGSDAASAAVKLGALLGADEVVVVRVRQQAPGAHWLAASLVSVSGGQEVRMGGLKLDSARADAQVGPLVTYVTTGEPTPSVVVLDKGKGRELWNAASAPTGSAAGLAEPEVAQDAGGSGRWQGLRAKAWMPAVGGAALLAGGTTFMVMARGRASSLRERDPSITNPADTVSSGKKLERLGVGLGAAGVLGLAAGGAMYLLDRPQSAAPQLSVVPVQGGAFATVSGTLP